MIRQALVALSIFTALPAVAQDLATGDAITATIAGNTVTGSMSDASGYTEFYTADGTIKGKDYTGTWTVEADKMCFVYGTDPATCFGVKIAGDQVTWVNDTSDAGTGTIQPGNPNNF